MPRIPRRGCAYGKCGRLAVEGGQYCKEHKATYERSPDVNKKYGRAWKRIRDRYVREHPFCERCFANGIMKPVEEVHHILLISQGGTHDPANLMSLCQSCHITELTAEIIRSFVEKIEVMKPEKVPGTRTKKQTIVIHWNFIGAVEIPDTKEKTA